jgi:hypothetical protein
MYTKGDMQCPQCPHVDFTWDTLLLGPRRGCLVASSDQVCLKYGHMPFTAHLPLTAEGSWIYLWTGPGRVIHFHIYYGFVLLLRGDVVHSSENPHHVDHTGKSYPLGFIYTCLVAQAIILETFFLILILMENYLKRITILKRSHCLS